MRGSRTLPGGAWTIPMIAFAGIWEALARLVHRPSLFPTFIDTLGSLPPLLTAALGWAVLSSLITTAISFVVAAALALALGALLKQSAAAQSSARILIWLTIVFLSLSLSRLAFQGFGVGSNAVYVVGIGTSFLLMIALLSGGLSVGVALNLGLLAAWAAVLSAEAAAENQGLGALVHGVGQDAAPEPFYALALLAALLGLALVTLVDVLAGRLNLVKGSRRR